jgi:hypothetical protein
MWPALEGMAAPTGEGGRGRLSNAQHCSLESQFHDVPPAVLAPVLPEFFAG